MKPTKGRLSVLILNPKFSSPTTKVFFLCLVPLPVQELIKAMSRLKSFKSPTRPTLFLPKFAPKIFGSIVVEKNGPEIYKEELVFEGNDISL